MSFITFRLTTALTDYYRKCATKTNMIIFQLQIYVNKRSLRSHYARAWLLETSFRIIQKTKGINKDGVWVQISLW